MLTNANTNPISRHRERTRKSRHRGHGAPEHQSHRYKTPPNRTSANPPEVYRIQSKKPRRPCHKGAPYCITDAEVPVFRLRWRGYRPIKSYRLQGQTARSAHISHLAFALIFIRVRPSLFSSSIYSPSLIIVFHHFKTDKRPFNT